MDEGRAEYTRQRSSSSSTSSSPASQFNYRSGSTPSMKRPQAKAAAQRLAQVMAYQGDDDEADQDGELMYDGGGSGSIGLGRPSPKPQPQRSPHMSKANPVSSPNRPTTVSLRQMTRGRSSNTSTPVKMIHPSVSISRRPSGGSPADNNSSSSRRLSVDIGRESSSHCVLQDELEMLQEENESLRGKLRVAEERIDEAEERGRQLEKQVASMGEGVTMEARLLSRKEASLQQREAALRLASAQSFQFQNQEIAALRMEAQSAREETTSALEHLHEAERENKAIRTMIQRLVLTQEEMEDVILKRCWLARYWNLCAKYGIYSEIAGARNEYWSSVSPRPLEAVVSAAKKDEIVIDRNDAEERAQVMVDGEGNVENMIVVEKGLREMDALKVGDAIALAMAKKGLTPLHSQLQPFELSQDQVDDVRFKQAWLTYYWRRAQEHGLEADIADERLQFWISHCNRHPSSQDAVDVERGLTELRMLGIEIQLWESSRRGLQLASINPRKQTDF